VDDLDVLDVVCLLGEDGLTVPLAAVGGEAVVAVVQLVAAQDKSGRKGAGDRPVGCLVEGLDMALGDGTPGVEALAGDGPVALLQGGPEGEVREGRCVGRYLE
jgi:hypothetical protein